MLKAVKVRLYPTPDQQIALAQSFGCVRWYWNHALNACIQHYQQTGKSLKLSEYKGMLPALKKEHSWLKEGCYSAVLQCVAINLNKAYTNFFAGTARFPKFKARQHKQSIQLTLCSLLDEVILSGAIASLHPAQCDRPNSNYIRRLRRGKRCWTSWEGMISNPVKQPY